MTKQAKDDSTRSTDSEKQFSNRFNSSRKVKTVELIVSPFQYHSIHAW